MKILCASDLHGRTSAYREFTAKLTECKADLGILAGDLTASTAGPAEEARLRAILKENPVPLLFIMGNMDRYEWQAGDNLVPVNRQCVKIRERAFIGYQYTNPFTGGPFEKSEAQQERDLAELAGLIGGGYILISHGPPFGVLDRVRGGRHAGSRALARFTQSRKPLYHVFGHIHESCGVEGGALNVSYPNSRAFWLIDDEARRISKTM